MKYALSVVCLAAICAYASGHYIKVHYPLNTLKQVAAKTTPKLALAMHTTQEKPDLVMERIMMITPNFKPRQCKPDGDMASISKDGNQYYFEYIKKLPKELALKRC